MTDRSEILARIGSEAPEEVMRLSREWLSCEDTHAIGASPAEVTAEEAARTWRLRTENLSSRGKQLAGSEHFLNALTGLKPSKKLVQFSFENSQFSGSVFFEKTNGRFVGVVVKHLQEPKAPTSAQERLVQFA